MTIALSINRILEIVYALSALESMSRPCPAILGRAQQKALTTLLNGAAARTIYSLTPFVDAVKLPASDGDDIIEVGIELIDADGYNIYSGLQPILEKAVADAVLESIWNGDKAISDLYASMFASQLATAKRILALNVGKPAAIRPAI